MDKKLFFFLVTVSLVVFGLIQWWFLWQDNWETLNTSNSETTSFTPFNYSDYISPAEHQSINFGLYWLLLPTPVTTSDQATSAKRSTYALENPLSSYSIGDNITVIITARDGLGRPKVYGGDFFQAKLFNEKLKASVFGEVVDLYNGTYTVAFRLLWEGQAKVSIRLIHSSEAVEVLRRHREQDPDKVYFQGVYRHGHQEERVVCNAQRSVRLVTGFRCCCEYRDPVTEEMWVCRLPSTLPCKAWVDHSFGGYQAQLSYLESALLQRSSTNVVIPGSDVTVNISSSEPVSNESVKCVPGLGTPVPAGFFLQDKWTSLLCRSQSFPSADAIVKCLKDKQVLMMGDSTLRQWFEYLVKTIPTLKQLKLFTSAKSGPFEAVDTGNNIRVIWRAHGLPLRTSMTPRADLHYIGSDVEALAGGEHSVVVFTIWAHFTTYPLDTYLQRVAVIRRAVLGLLSRAPQTLVVIKSANTGYKDVYGSDWLSWQLECALRIMFKNLPVVIIDVWQMTSCHYSPDQIHPPPVVIKNEVGMFLSFVCPV